MPLDEAVEQAIGECIQEGILAEFLRHNRAEVYQMSIFEYDKEEEEKKLRKAEYEYGREEERTQLLMLLSRMNAGGDAEQIPQLNNPEVLKEMKRKYEIE